MYQLALLAHYSLYRYPYFKQPLSPRRTTVRLVIANANRFSDPRHILGNHNITLPKEPVSWENLAGEILQLVDERYRRNIPSYNHGHVFELRGTGGMNAKDLEELFKNPRDGRAILIDPDSPTLSEGTLDFGVLYANPVLTQHPGNIAKSVREWNLQRAREAKSPSETCSNIDKLRTAMRVHPISSAGRPPEVSGPNVVIFSGPAALLLEHVQNLGREPVDPDLYDACAALSDVCAKFYSTEAERRRAAQPILDRLFGVTTSERGNPRPASHKGTPVAFDLVEVVRTGDGKTDAFILCVEVKNELGKAGPGHLQIEFTFQNLVCQEAYRPIRDNSLCPTILVNISDGYIRIAYAIFTDT
ncbi:hypothetical protein LXA43DRAFT_1069898, partial [Ganoderma leucocontextum]